MKQIIGTGAEAIIYKSGSAVIKNRIGKAYRLADIDNRLRKYRTRREAKIMDKLSSINFPAPKLLNFCDKEMLIEMEHIPGEKLRDILNNENCIRLSNELGKKIAILHNNGIIHGDLTTSNMILKGDDLHFIDFGLGFFSDKTEDKAVDLHLLKQALESRHYKIWKECFDAVTEEYCKNNPQHKEIFDRLEKVESRGRYKRKDYYKISK